MMQTLEGVIRLGREYPQNSGDQVTCTRYLRYCDHTLGQVGWIQSH